MIKLRLPGWALTLSFYLLSLSATIVLSLALVWIAPDNPIVTFSTSDLYLLPSELRPEPRDRFLFITICASATAIVIVASFLWSQLKLGKPDKRPIAVFSVFALLLVAAWCAFVKVPALSHMIGLVPVLLVTGLIAYGAIKLPLRTAQRCAVAIGIAVSACFILKYRIFSISEANYQFYFIWHFDAVLFSLVHVARGGTCLADVVVQYGCYSEFISPFLKIFGTTVLNVTFIMSSIQLIAFACMAFFAASIVKNPTLLLAALFSILLSINVILFIGYNDPYYQYFPIRYICPAVSLMAAAWCQKSPTHFRVGMCGLFSGASCGWNVDSGVAVSISLLIFCSTTRIGIVSERKMKEAATRAVFFIAGAAASLGLFLMYLSLKSGGTISLSKFIVYQQMFYLSGLFMLPIPAFPAAWALPALIVFAVLSWTAIAARSSILTLRDERAAYVAILCIGLFLYYTGRSHWIVLDYVSWPAILLAFYLIDNAFPNNRTFPASLLASAALALPVWVAIFQSSIPKDSGYGTVDFRDDLSLVAQNTQAGERVMIFAPGQGAMYAETATIPYWAGPSLAEAILKSDLTNLIERSKNVEKIFLGLPLFGFNFDQKTINLERYELIQSTPRLSFYRRK